MAENLQKIKSDFLFSRDIPKNHEAYYESFSYDRRSGVEHILIHEDGLFLGTPRIVYDFYNRCYQEAINRYNRNYKNSNQFRDLIDFLDICPQEYFATIFNCSHKIKTSDLDFENPKPKDNLENLIKDCFLSCLFRELKSSLNGYHYRDLTTNQKIEIARALAVESDERDIKDSNYDDKVALISSKYEFYSEEVEGIFDRLEEEKHNYKKDKKEYIRNVQDIEVFKEKKKIEVEAKKQIIQAETEFLRLSQKIAEEQDDSLKKLQQDQADFYMKQILEMKKMVEND